MLSFEKQNLEFELHPEDIVEAIDYDDADLEDIAAELRDVEDAKRITEHELDILKAVLVYILMKEGVYDKEDVFSLIFGNGRRIVWQ